MSEMLEYFQKLNSHTPIDVEMWLPNLSFRKSNKGPIHRVSLEVKEDFWNALKHLPHDNLRFLVTLTVIGDNEEGTAAHKQQAAKEKKEPKPAYPAKAKGPYAGFAGRLFALGFFSSPGIKALLHKWEKTYSAEDEADAVHCAFGVASRAEISPDAWRNALELEFDRSYSIKSVLDIIKAAEEQAAKVVQ